MLAPQPYSLRLITDNRHRMDHPTVGGGVVRAKVMPDKTFLCRDINPLFQRLSIATYFQPPNKSNITVPMLYCCGSTSPNGTDGTLSTRHTNCGNYTVSTIPIAIGLTIGLRLICATQKCFGASHTN